MIWAIKVILFLPLLLTGSLICFAMLEAFSYLTSPKPKGGAANDEHGGE